MKCGFKRVFTELLNTVATAAVVVLSVKGLNNSF